MLAHGWQNIHKGMTYPKGGVVWSREPFKFWLGTNHILERLIVSGAVNLGGQSVEVNCDGLGHQFIIMSVDICMCTTR